MSLVTIGKIIKTRGIKGELKVYPYTEDYCMEYYCSLPNLWIGVDEEKVEKHQVVQSRVFQNFFLFIFEGIDDPQKAFLLTKKFVFVSHQQRMPLRAGEVFTQDLLGSEVFLHNGRKLGVVVDFFHNGANGVCEVKSIEGSKKNFLFPTTRQVLQEVNGAEKKLIIEPLEGMLE